MSERPKVSEAEQARRRPPPPEELVGALQDRIHIESGKVRSAKSAHVLMKPGDAIALWGHDSPTAQVAEMLLADVELESPPFTPDALKEFERRGFERKRK